MRLFIIVIVLAIAGIWVGIAKAEVVCPPTDTPQPSETPLPPTETPFLTDTPFPTDTPVPTDTPQLTDTPQITDTPQPSDTPGETPPPDTPTMTATVPEQTLTPTPATYTPTITATQDKPSKPTPIPMLPQTGIDDDLRLLFTGALVCLAIILVLNVYRYVWRER